MYISVTCMIKLTMDFDYLIKNAQNIVVTCLRRLTKDLGYLTRNAQHILVTHVGDKTCNAL